VIRGMVKGLGLGWGGEERGGGGVVRVWVGRKVGT
jgi:hypothetical protein